MKLIKKKRFNSFESFLKELASQNDQISYASLYNAITKAAKIYKTGDYSKLNFVNHISQEQIPNSFFMTLPHLGWTLCLLSTDNGMYNVCTVKYRCVSSTSDYGITAAYLKYFVDIDHCIEVKLYLGDPIVDRLEHTESLGQVIDSYSDFFKAISLFIIGYSDIIIYKYNKEPKTEDKDDG